MQNRNTVREDVASEQWQKFEEEQRKLVVQRVKLPNGATFTRLEPVVFVIDRLL